MTAVDGLTFTVRPGAVTGFLGPNGAGKSTTLRIILGLDAPTSGTALVGGRRYREFTRPLHQVGSLLDATAVPAGRSAWFHLLALAQSNGVGKKRVTEVLELTGLAAVADRRVGEFSLGMKQRLGLAAALLADPPVLLLDEPVNGLDTDGIRWIRRLLRSMAAEGRTVLVSSHLMSEMALTADHLIIIGRGRLLADTSTERFVSGAQRDVLVRSPRARHRRLRADSPARLTGGRLPGRHRHQCWCSRPSTPILAGHHRGLSLAHPGALRAVLAAGLVLPACALVAVGAGAVVRHTAGAIAAAVAVVFLLVLLAWPAAALLAAAAVTRRDV